MALFVGVEPRSPVFLSVICKDYVRTSSMCNEKRKEGDRPNEAVHGLGRFRGSGAFLEGGLSVSPHVVDHERAPRKVSYQDHLFVSTGI